ncbi:hypothetical protein CR513_48031, partial [Mucuna pruriens]
MQKMVVTYKDSHDIMNVHKDNPLFVSIRHGSSSPNRSGNTLLKSPGRSQIGRGRMDSEST